MGIFKVSCFIICIGTMFCARAQQVSLLKSTVSNAGGSYSLLQSGLMLNQTIGQSSLTGHFNSGSVHLLQGFQHPYLQSFVFNLTTPQTLSVYPNPSSGIIMLDWLPTNETEKIIEQLTISLFNMEGKLIKEEIFPGNRTPIKVDYGTINKGVYLVTLAGKKSELGSAIIILN